MKSGSTTSFCIRVPGFRVLSYGILLFCLLHVVTMGNSYAAPAPGAMGGGPVCPPACPPSPTNCDANLVLTRTQDLQFGLIAAPAAGTVTVDPTGIRSSTGGVVLVPGGTVNPATYNMSTVPYNCAGRALAIITVTEPTVLTHTTLGATMTVTNYVTVPAPGAAFDPTVPLSVGGTLNVSASQAPGAYSGNILITVTFQ